MRPVNRTTARCLALPATTLIAGLVLGPLLLLLRISLCLPATGRGFYLPGTWTIGNFAHVADPHVVSLIGFTLGFGLAVATLVLAVAYPLSLFVVSLPRTWQTVALGLILIPKTAGLLAVLFGLQRWLPRGLSGALVAEVYLVLPYCVLVLYLYLLQLDPLWQEAACGLGASRWQIFCRVTCPLSRPGLALAFQFGLLWGLAAFLGPLFLGGPQQTTLAIELHRQAFEYGRWPLAAAEAVSLLVLATWAALGLPMFLTWRKDVPR